jgi:hypothetical protein
MADIIEKLRGTEILDAIREIADEAANALEASYARYDDAMKRIQDLTAELEYLRREVNRG